MSLVAASGRVAEPGAVAVDTVAGRWVNRSVPRVVGRGTGVGTGQGVPGWCTRGGTIPGLPSCTLARLYCTWPWPGPA